MSSGVQQSNKRTRSGRGCRQCKHRKVKCDETHDTCHNCNRLGFDCTYDHDSSSSGPRGTDLPLPKRRTRQACQICRSSKLRCSGDFPKCQRCQSHDLDCIYVRVSAEDSVSSPAPSSTQRLRQIRSPAFPHDIISTLPDARKSILQNHIDAFFHYVYPTATFNFFHKGSFLRAWHTGKIAKDLVQTVAGVAARFIARNDNPGRRSKPPEDRPGSHWLEEVQKALLLDLESVSIPRIQIMLLLIFNHIAEGRLMTGWNILALACRHAFALNLNRPTDAILFTNQECRRRLTWCVWYLDRTLIQTEGRPAEWWDTPPSIPQCPRDQVRVPLPCSNRLFGLEQETRTVFLDQMAAGQIGNPETLGVTAYLIRIIDIRDPIREYLQDSHNASMDDDTKIFDFQKQLDLFQKLLPPEMRDTERAMYLHVSTPDIGVYVMVHTWLHTTICELNMHVVGLWHKENHYAETFIEVDDGIDHSEFYENLTRHAKALNQFWRRLHSVQRFSERFFTTDTSLGHCVMVNTIALISIAKRTPGNVHGASVGDDHNDLKSIEEALRLNIEIMTSLAKISPVIQGWLYQIFAEIGKWESPTAVTVVEDFHRANPGFWDNGDPADQPLFLDFTADKAREREDARFPKTGRAPQGPYQKQVTPSHLRRQTPQGVHPVNSAGTDSVHSQDGTSADDLAGPPTLTWYPKAYVKENNNTWDGGGKNADYISTEALSGFAAQNLYGAGGDEDFLGDDPGPSLVDYYSIQDESFDMPSTSAATGVGTDGTGLSGYGHV